MSDERTRSSAHAGSYDPIEDPDPNEGPASLGNVDIPDPGDDSAVSPAVSPEILRRKQEALDRMRERAARRS